MNIDWTLFDFVFTQQDEKFDEITIRNNLENYVQYVNIFEKLERPYNNSKLGVGFRLPNLWERVTRKGLVKSNLFFHLNNDNSEHINLNVKALKWDDNWIAFAGAQNHLRYRTFGMGLFGGAFYKVNPGVLVGVNSKINGVVGSEIVDVQIKPSLIINALDFSAELSVESIMKGNRVNAIYVKKPELSTSLMPYIHVNASYTWATREAVVGVGAAFTRFWLFSRLGFQVERNFKTAEDRLGVFADNGPVVSKLFVHKKETETADIGLDLEFKDMKRYINNLGRVNLQLGVTSSKWNTGFMGLTFDFN